MTDANHKAWEIALAKLSPDERERVHEIAELMRVDPSDPVWPMLAAAGFTREGMLEVMSEAAEEVDKSRKRLSEDVEAVRDQEFTRFREQLKQERAQFAKELREQHEKAVQQYKAESRAQHANVNGTRREGKQRATAWTQRAAVILVVAVAVAFAAGTVAGRQYAAATHDRIAERFQGPYSTEEEELLNITNTNLGRADEIIQECQENAFTPDQGGRACQIAVWVKKPDASDARTSRSWPDRLQSWISDLL